MKPQLLKIPLATECSFSIRHDQVPHFYNRWHYHPEIELVHIQQGSGTQFSGDSIQRFEPGDVLLVGTDLPHYWRCDGDYFNAESDLVAEATVITINTRGCSTSGPSQPLSVAGKSASVIM